MEIIWEKNFWLLFVYEFNVNIYVHVRYEFTMCTLDSRVWLYPAHLR